MTSQSANVGQLLGTAVADGILSKAALQAINVRDIGDEINNALGVSVDDVKSSEVILVTQLIDDSGSIRMISGNTEAVREGHNLVLESLSKTKQRDGIISMTRYLNQGLLYAYTPVDKAVRLDSKNYNPTGGTPLYAESVTTLGAVLTKTQEFIDNGIPCRTVTAIITDGGDSTGQNPDKVRKIVGDMLRAENHIVAGIGIDDGTTDFKAVFNAMGILDQWILTPKNTPSEIRRAFNTLSQSAVRASQAGGTFSQAALGGFAAP